MVLPVVGIMHVPVPSRVRNLPKIIERLGNLPHLVCEDPGLAGPWETCKMLLQAGIETDATHICILPDDCLPCKGFGDALHRAVGAVPNEVVSIYTNTPHAGTALSSGKSWLTRINGITQMVLPRAIAIDFLEFVDKYVPQHLIEGFKEDGLLNLYCMATRRVSWTTAVSLIDHTGKGSLQGHEDHAHRRPFIQPYEDMSQINWETDAVFCGRQKETHWALLELSADGREKYKVHEIVFEYAGHRHPGS